MTNVHQYLNVKSSKLQSVEGRGRKNSQYSKPEKVLVLISSEGVFPVTAFFTIIETFFLRKVFVESKFRLNRKLLPRGSGVDPGLGSNRFRNFQSEKLH